ncbi:hypothetical protein QQS45_03390 [Alteriqipengyuania flavescens]|uniref:hypothetical protein n=1 Tax=Alteriqipengyuania flavescens TaxID=3053610 RepID=UPI0025B43D03|nr:hypothetical protein [Alteriqipengyuania flavescens]WJY19289.1 hypothetical protein QQW98_03385 [Alteriqipengyuania flavescens]WJY25230.1 hypothetical protein QQS45_03390 [Alteriqipengyuania flavescens]
MAMFSQTSRAACRTRQSRDPSRPANLDAILGPIHRGSLSDNIALFDEKVDQQRVMAAAHAASIHADIAAMPMQYG